MSGASIRLNLHLLKVRSYPKKILGQKVDFGDADTSKQKMIYLSETIANYSVDKPGKEKIEVISTKVSGRPNDYGLSAPRFFSFYEENVDSYCSDGFLCRYQYSTSPENEMEGNGRLSPGNEPDLSSC